MFAGAICQYAVALLGLQQLLVRTPVCLETKRIVIRKHERTGLSMHTLSHFTIWQSETLHEALLLRAGKAVHLFWAHAMHCWVPTWRVLWGFRGMTSCAYIWRLQRLSRHDELTDSSFLAASTCNIGQGPSDTAQAVKVHI